MGKLATQGDTRLHLYMVKEKHGNPSHPRDPCPDSSDVGPVAGLLPWDLWCDTADRTCDVEKAEPEVWAL